MTRFRLEGHAFVLLLWIDTILAIALIILLLATFATRHLVLPHRLYLAAAITASLGLIAFLAARGEVTAYSGGILSAVLTLFVPALPFTLLGEVILLAWLGIRKL